MKRIARYERFLNRFDKSKSVINRFDRLADDYLIDYFNNPINSSRIRKAFTGVAITDYSDKYYTADLAEVIETNIHDYLISSAAAEIKPIANNG